MFIPFICVLIFSIIGTWMLLEPVVAYYIIHFPELVGRISFIVFFQIVTHPIILNFHIRFFPIRSVFFYADLLDEAKLMQEIPLGGEEDDD